jgi:MFS family permease
MTVISGIVSFWLGAMVDGQGARRLMLVGTTIMGLGLIATAAVDELWQFLLLRGLVYTVGFAAAGSLVVNTVLAKWFVERRGWAIAVASVGVSASAVVVPPVMTPVIEEYGWREGWVVLGVAAMLLMYPVSLMMRREPEHYGLQPDGKSDDGSESPEERERQLAAARADFENSFTRAEAVHTWALWVLIVAFGLGSVGLIGIFIHGIPFVEDQGWSKEQAALAFSTQGVAALLSKFHWGWWMQRFHPRLLTALSFVMAGVSILGVMLTAEAGQYGLMLVCFFVWGWGIGGQIPLQEFIWASYFGRRHIGSVRAIAMPFTIVFSAGGPLFAGTVHDITDSYRVALFSFAAMWAVGAVLMLILRQPVRPQPRAEVHPPAELAGGIAGGS